MNQIRYTGERVIPKFMGGKYAKNYRNHLARYVLALKYVSGKKVLDASCGSGYGVDLMYDLAEQITGVDISRETIDYANDSYRGGFSVCDLEREFPNYQFDMVVSFETIEHLNNPRVFLENVKNHSKEFLFSVPIEKKLNTRGFHKRTYTVGEAMGMISNVFGGSEQIEWFNQKGTNIYEGSPEDASFLIGHIIIKHD